MSVVKRRDYVTKNMNKVNGFDIHKTRKSYKRKKISVDSYLDVYDKYQKEENEYINELMDVINQ